MITLKRLNDFVIWYFFSLSRLYLVQIVSTFSSKRRFKGKMGPTLKLISALLESVASAADRIQKFSTDTKPSHTFQSLMAQYMWSLVENLTISNNSKMYILDFELSTW